MGLNIKNEHVHELAREVARRTGRNQTSAIELALERLLAELRREDDQTTRLSLIRLMQRAAIGIDLDTETLYDTAGLPR
ncbi:type II toxin-antitoxin system VapB family antitoxin [Williamsia sterculiae]|uniref:Antitoxin VapB n=1 Tax=Williamsia sterculiae TaxID=1344003 RepID=A0A1N7FTV7_9NOCA|nr:type II toxin-antitoxin system VapB family antitoxin [Williamsia sterculiae]SIS03675.1 antitoxin VapB [Williamsia sterculiae]